MSTPREPLHQPPDPAGLRRVPPASPACATVRGWLRDFVDQDLEAAHVVELEEHVHGCRTCAIELGRAEHERLRVVRALVAATPTTAALPHDFAARVVNRLVLDDTSRVSVRDLAAAAAAASARRAEATPRPSAARERRSSPILLLIGALATACVLGLLAIVADELGDPQRHARLVVVAADGTFHRQRVLGVGDGLRDNQALRVAKGGGARVEWHDTSSRPQPAATLRMHSQSQACLNDGTPMLSGRVDIATTRPVAIPLADGSTLEFGVGDYSVSIEPPPEAGEGNGALDDPLAEIPRELLIEVEVRLGDEARIVRSGIGATLVGAGFVGVYQGNSEISVVRIGGPAVSMGREDATNDVSPPAPPPASSRLWGSVVDEAGQPCAGADLLLTLYALGVPVRMNRVAGNDGTFHVEGPSDVSVPWSMVVAVPPASRPELGILAPDVHRIVREGQVSSFVRRFELALSPAVVGNVRDDAGQPRDGVLVVPCIVDDVFGMVLPMLGERRLTHAGGRFEIGRLPASLPPQQSLRLVLLHEDLATVSVAVPERGSPLGTAELPLIEMRQLRWVRLHALPANSSVDLLEEVPGLPAGAGLVRRRVTTDGAGVVPLTRIAWQPLWALYGGATTPVVRQMVFDDLAGVPRMRPAPGTVTPFAAVFQPLQAVPGSEGELANSYRHQNLGDLASEGIETRSLRVVDAGGAPLADAQVFWIGSEEARGRRAPRFVGVTGATGEVDAPAPGGVWSLEPFDGGLVVLGPRGVVLRPAVENDAVAVEDFGRAIVAPALRPIAPTAVMTLEFLPVSWRLPGPPPVFTRHVGEANGWEANGLAPGRYSVRVGGHETTIEVPSGGFVTIGP